VPLDLARVTELALSDLSDGERRSSAVYLDTRELAAGATITIGRTSVTAPARGFVAFVDPTPTANWSHPCRYLLIEHDTGVIHPFPARFPPFLREVPSTLMLIWKGPDVPASVLPDVPAANQLHRG
jgi:hypothetical protein